MHPRNQPQRMRKPDGRVSEAVTSAGSAVTIPAFAWGIPARQTLAATTWWTNPPDRRCPAGRDAMSMELSLTMRRHLTFTT
jgi:hypothetical protein